VTTRRSEILFSMSAFSGLLAIRIYSTAHPGLSLVEVITALKRVSPDDGYHDYEAALVLHDWVESDTEHTHIPTFFRHILTTLIQRTNPWWRRFFPLGRDRVKSVLNSNEQQCFEAAGLFSETPDPEIRKWWDTLQQAARSEDDNKRLLQGREAEQLTIDYETRRLSDLGIPNRPRWIAIDDNTAGYDVHSFDKGPVEPIAKLIEVKSCSRVPEEIFLTRNEWETAVEMAPNYRFHIWILPEEQLIELTPSDIEKHIPLDRGDGLWQITRIAISSSAGQVFLQQNLTK
jgi:hypothetical protein